MFLAEQSSNLALKSPINSYLIFFPQHKDENEDPLSDANSTFSPSSTDSLPLESDV